MGIPLDALSKAELAAINKRYGWLTGTEDSKGRVLGNREKVFEIPDEKVRIAQSRLGLAGKGVVEFGCHEGAHTVALARAAATVTALEGREENVEKTLVRLGLYGQRAMVIKADLEDELPPAADLFFHSGVLYHLTDPAGHLLRICPLTQEMLLDTHYAVKLTASYTSPVDGKERPCWNYGEDKSHPKSGMRDFARWLSLKEIRNILGVFFKRVDVVKDRMERNGPRVTITAGGRK